MPLSCLDPRTPLAIAEEQARALTSTAGGLRGLIFRKVTAKWTPSSLCAVCVCASEPQFGTAEINGGSWPSQSCHEQCDTKRLHSTATDVFMNERVWCVCSTTTHVNRRNWRISSLGASVTWQISDEKILEHEWSRMDVGCSVRGHATHKSDWMELGTGDVCVCIYGYLCGVGKDRISVYFQRISRNTKNDKIRTTRVM